MDLSTLNAGTIYVTRTLYIEYTDMKRVDCKTTSITKDIYHLVSPCQCNLTNSLTTKPLGMCVSISRVNKTPTNVLRPGRLAKSL